MTPIIVRTYNKKITTGNWMHDDELICHTLELPWQGNERRISCIPEGFYNVIKQKASNTRPYDFFRITNVQGRSGILIHKITYVKDLLGCIGVGMELKDLNRDGTVDMIRSGEALSKLMSILPDQFTLNIVDASFKRRVTTIEQ